MTDYVGLGGKLESEVRKMLDKLKTLQKDFKECYKNGLVGMSDNYVHLDMELFEHH